MIVILAVPYIISILRKTNQQIPFFKALNPFYNKQMYAADELKKSLSPITNEMETQRVAKFINHWTAKFEQNRLSVEDVKGLNTKIAEGAVAQVNGILALHPDARTMFNAINAQLKEEENVAAPVEAEVLV